MARVSKRLPICPPPQKDELLSSWLVRLSRANSEKLSTFTKLIFDGSTFHSQFTREPPTAGFWLHDPDRSINAQQIEALSKATGQSPQQLEQLTLLSLKGQLAHGIPRNGNVRWLLHTGTHNSKGTRKGLQFCPACLAEDAQPYFRRSWRLAFVTVCPKHRLLLSDSCSHCQNPVQIRYIDRGSSRRDVGQNSIIHCYACGADLRQNHQFSATKSSIPQSLLQVTLTYNFKRSKSDHWFSGAERLQTWLLESMAMGTMNLRDLTLTETPKTTKTTQHRKRLANQLVGSPDFFAGLYSLVRLFLKPPLRYQKKRYRAGKTGHLRTMWRRGLTHAVRQSTRTPTLECW
jgi:hypothetical protein